MTAYFVKFEPGSTNMGKSWQAPDSGTVAELTRVPAIDTLEVGSAVISDGEVASVKLFTLLTVYNVCVYECDECGVEMQVGLELLAGQDQKVTLGQLASLDCKAHQAGRVMLEHLEILEHKVLVDNQDHRVQLVSLETLVPLVM